MRKLFILKSLVDVFWVVSIPVVLFLALGIPLIYFIEDSGNFKILGLDFASNKTLLGKSLSALFLISYLLIYISVFKFRIILNEFLRTRIFSEKVIANLRYIGNCLLFSGFLMIVSRTLFIVLIKSKITFDLGISAHFLCIVFGLFFLVLAEVFKISKNLKQENDLTI